MTNEQTDAAKQQVQAQQNIETSIRQIFASEDEGLKNALKRGQEAGLPGIQISPIQGKFLQILAGACQAQKILEIGSLAGYSGIWLARALPLHGRLITLEINPKHAEVVRRSFAQAGLSERTEVRVGKALELLPQLESEAPFDLIFIDADKASYPSYLNWAIRLSRTGSIIVADNTIRNGRALHETTNMDNDTAGLVQYNKLASSNPRLLSLALAIDEGNTDGFTISVVQPE